jgi:chromosome segregation ATPase
MYAQEQLLSPLIEQLQSRLTAVLEELEGKNAAYSQLQRQFGTTNEELKGLKEHIDVLLSSRDSFGDRVTALEEALHERDAQIAQLTEDIATLENEKAKEAAAIEAIRPRVLELVETQGVRDEIIFNLQHELASKEAGLSELNEQLKAQVELTSKNNVHTLELEREIHNVRQSSHDSENSEKKQVEFQKTLQNNLERQGKAARKRISELMQTVQVWRKRSSIVTPGLNTSALGHRTSL